VRVSPDCTQFAASFGSGEIKVYELGSSPRPSRGSVVCTTTQHSVRFTQRPSLPASLPDLPDVLGIVTRVVCCGVLWCAVVCCGGCGVLLWCGALHFGVLPRCTCPYPRVGCLQPAVASVLEWDPTGLRLFSGDGSGAVVVTRVNRDAERSKFGSLLSVFSKSASEAVCTETSAIVQACRA
jgi:hypothetical protein